VSDKLRNSLECSGASQLERSFDRCFVVIHCVRPSSRKVVRSRLSSHRYRTECRRM
jgi:hypothetical protein